jgi:hypothetical protein
MYSKKTNMTYEHLQQPDYIIAAACKADIPSIEIYADIDGAKEYYEAFTTMYRNPDSIIRNRGGIDITYGQEVFSGLSLDGRHMFSVRMSQMPFGTELADTQRYFVVSGDFHTKGTPIEWWITKVSDKTIFLNHQPMSEVPHEQLYEDTFSLDAVMNRRLAERAALDADYSSYRLTIGQNAVISWGDGKRPEKFMSFRDLAQQLELLRMAEERTKNTTPGTHEQHLAATDVA